MARNGNVNNDKALRHLALQIAAQLPLDVADARQVLCLCRELVEKFIAADNHQPETTLKLVCSHGKNESPH